MATDLTEIEFDEELATVVFVRDDFSGATSFIEATKIEFQDNGIRVTWENNGQARAFIPYCNVLAVTQQEPA